MYGLYIHIPFCVKKCSYCDFISYTNCSELYCAYTDALINELKKYAGMRIDTIFIGGGTPTVLDEKELVRIAKTVFSNFNIDADYEFTVEANPGTMSDDKIKALLSAGVNRLSIGVQSFNDYELKRIGRIHNSKTACNTVLSAKKLGFKNINVDLMQSIPGQNTESLLNSIKTAKALDVEHISCYSLIIEEGTPLEREYSKGLIKLPNEDEDREMYEKSSILLKDSGYKRYEISNYAKEGKECRHNIKYWECREYIGAGTAAHSYLNGDRYYNTSSLKEYISGVTECERIHLTESDKQSEFVFMGLRMDKGISETEFKRRFNKDIFSVFGKPLNKFLDLGLLIQNRGRICLSGRGRDISNTVLCEFV